MGDCEQHVQEVLVCGGGDAGLLAALLVTEVTSVNVTVVDDFSQDPPAVGKSTFASIIPTLHDVLGIDEQRFREEVKPVWKTSVWFKDWCGEEFHTPFDIESYFGVSGNDNGEEMYHRYLNGEYTTLGSEIAEQRKSPYRFEGENEDLARYHSVAYHLGLNRFSTFLQKLCTERGIELRDDRIVNVTAEDGRIQHVASEGQTYTADLFIDSTGFARVLMSELENPFDAFPLPLDSAIVATVDIDVADIVPATVTRSGDHGWFWQIDTYETRDLGYVYSSSHVSDEDAMTEFMESYSTEYLSREELKRFNYESGTLQNAWVGNCVAIGNSYGFVEPLQSFGLTVSAGLALQLGEILKDTQQWNFAGVRDFYNNVASQTWGEIYDFIETHYRYADGETEFWNDVSDLRDTDVPQYNLYDEIGYTRLHSYTSPGTRSRYAGYSLYHVVLQGLGEDSTFYEKATMDIPPEVKNMVRQQGIEIQEEANQLLSYEDLYGERKRGNGSSPSLKD